MQVTINGETRELPEPCVVSELLRTLDLLDRPCAVEINKRVIPRSEHEQHQVQEGDRIEIVTLVGGG